MNTAEKTAARSASLPVTPGRIADFAADPVAVMRRLRAAHGEIAALEEDGQRLYFTFGPEPNKQVLSDSTRFHSRFFAARGARKSAQRRVTSGLLSMNGDEHKQQRRIVMEPFARKMITGYHNTVAAMTQGMIDRWQPGEVRDINEEMTQYMLRLTSSILFGLDHEELAYRVGRLTERWVALNHEIGPAAFNPDAECAATYDELLSVAEELEDAVQEMVRIRRSGELGRDVLSLLIRAHENGEGISDEQLIGHITLLFAAAHLTSAHTLTWVLFLLSQHPQVMRELHAELEANIDGVPRPEQLEQLPVLDRVLKESMRVLPASSYSQRIAAEPVRLGPFDLPQGAIVIFSQFMTHHSPDLYEQPESFLPDRWKDLNPSPYAYLPFGAGPRMCIGAALGMMQFKISLPTILRRFKLTVERGAEINGRVMSTMLFPTSAVPMRIELQDGQFVAHPVGGNIHTLVDLPSKAADHRKVAGRRKSAGKRKVA
jgi:cytochrome P450